MEKILIVEDEEPLVQALKDNLEAEGFAVEVAMNGDEALERVRKGKLGLILLDLLLPHRDGLSVLEEVRKDPELRSIPVIVLSNLGGDDVIKRALEMGADDYFVKSQHSIDEVIAKIREYLLGGESASPPKVGT